MEFYVRTVLYLIIPFIVIYLRKNELYLMIALLAIFALLSYGRALKLVGGVLLFGFVMAALEALCIHNGMWKYFRVEHMIPMWLPILWSITIYFIWAVRPYLT
jgi:hypothetical protein